ncbi:MAG: response regulator transcription factor [Nitriliruptoraceae bacterium]
MRILVVEDDRSVRDALDRALRAQDLEVVTAGDGLAALSAVAEHDPDLVVLDLGLPGMDGLAVCRRLRADGDDRPVLVLTARDGVDDRVTGLDVGADDYLVKPFALEELLARVRALLRRVTVTPDQRLRVADLTIDPATREVWRGDRALELTDLEFRLLVHLAEHPRIVLRHEILLDAVWGSPDLTTKNTLEVYIGYLRRKLEAGGEPRMLHTVRGVGYVLRPPR